MNPDGTISVAPGTLGGTYLYPYTICLLPPNATVCDSAVATVEVEAAPSLTVAKSAGAPSGNTAGSTISYSFLVTNTGNVTLTGIVINDAQLDAAASCPLTTLNPGETTTCTGVHTITQAEVNAGTSDNTATASGTPPVGAPVTSPPSTTNTPIAAAPSLTVVKSAGAPSGNTAGSTISYSFLVTNTGNVTLTGIVINDAQLDAAASCPLTTLNPGETTTCTGVHTITQTEVNAGTSDNTATASGTPPVGAPVTSPPSTTNTPIAAAPSLTVVKSAGAPSGNTAGSTIAYSFLVTNTGNVTLTGIVINDAQLDAAASCPLTTLNPGETTTCTGVHTITQTEVNAGTSDNTATASGTPPVGAPVTSPPSTTNTPIAAAPSLTVVKSAGAATTNLGASTTVTDAGDTIAYSFLVTNTGNVTLTAIVINDAQLDAPATCPLTTLNPGETTTCTGVHTITQAEVNAGTSDNTATASGTPPVGAPVTSPPSTTNTPIASNPALTVDKTAGTPTTNLGANTTVTDAGDTIDYSFLVTNTGNVTLTGIVINDAQLDAPATCPLTTLNPGESTTCTGVHTITLAEVNAGTSDNTATASGTPPVGAPVTSPPSTANTPIASEPALTVEKSAGTPTTNLGSSTTVTDAGDTIDYSFLVTNTGNVTLTGIVINDAQLDAPATCPLTTLNPGETTTCTGVHTITLAEVNAGGVDNTATATGSPPSGDPVTSPPSTVNTPVSATASIELVKTADAPTLPTVGSDIQYTFVATNTGNVTLNNVTITDPLPGLSALSCTPVQPATLDPGQALSCTATYTVTTADLNAGGVDNTASVSGTPPSGPAATDDDTVSTPATPVLDVSKVLTAESLNTDGAAQPGEQLTYTITVTNQAGVPATDVIVVEQVPGNTTFVSGAPTWSCAPGSVGGTTCETLVNVPAFSAGNPGTVTATFVVQVADPLDDVVQSIANVVTLDGEPPADCVVMPDAPQCVVLPTLNLHLEKSVVGVNPTGPGSFNVVYQLLVRNAGSAEGSYTLFDTLDFTTSGVSFFADALVTTADGSINAALVGGRFTPANGATVQVSAADVAIPGGSSHTYVLTVPIAVNNDALANGECTGGPGNGLFNAADVDGPMTLASTACAPIGGSGDAAIRLLKTVQLAVDFNNNGYGDVGDVLNYSLVISNRGSQPLTNLALLDWQVTDLACEAQTASGAPITVLINNQIFRSSFEVLGGAGLLPNDSVQCWATHTITAGDVAARRVTNVATAKGQGAAGQTVTATSTAIYSAFP
ncbi:MAG: DUF11 domain-containing protein [Xanthomonadales bacterium]|nr:DUF11 domain-containing protein [Xanthomonadales bacterium]